MPEYFVVRSSTDESEKKWVLREIKAGRLRQGWFAHKVTALVADGQPTRREIWIRNFSNVVARELPNPTTQKEKQRRTTGFALQKYRELMRLLDIPEGARLIVPKLDPNAGENGFVLARAAIANPSLGPSNGCYWFDLKGRPSGAPKDDYRHIVAVDRASVRPVSRDFSKLAASLCDQLKLRQAPVVHSKKEDFKRLVERIYLETTRNPDGKYDPKPAHAEVERQRRELVEREIMQRRGQAEFRQRLLDAYERRCTISGCNAEDALEAAHIRTFEGQDDHDLRNGLLLRADLHTLFDLGLISVRTSTWTVVVAARLKGTSYSSLQGRSVKLPSNEELWPKKALDHHRRSVFNPGQ